jgi:hypothetical protein
MPLAGVPFVTAGSAARTAHTRDAVARTRSVGENLLYLEAVRWVGPPSSPFDAS